jgi:large subunit ribosomal protein L28
MSRVCQVTGRGTRAGNSRSHSNIATRRTFAVNLQTKVVDGKRIRLSAKAIKTLAKHAAAK